MNAQIFLEQLERLFQKRAASFSQLDADEPGAAPLQCVFFEETPRPGYTVAVTYGLSLGTHPEWTGGRPELMICVNSPSEQWGEAVMRIALSFRGECPFAYGNILSYGDPITEEAGLSAFVAHAPALPGRALTPAETTIPLEDRTVHLVGMYPLYEGEVALIERIGLDGFGALPDYDPWDIRRPDLSAVAS